MSRRSWVWLFAFLLCSLPALALTTKSVNEGVTAEQLAALLSGPGATITNVKISGSNLGLGSFAEGAAIDIDSGVVLSTGNIADATGGNDSDESGADVGTPGHPALDAIVAPFLTHDATVIEFDVVTVSPTFVIRYVFASEEYREWVDSEFNDVFAFFVNGTNVALTPGTSSPVTVNTINHNRNNSMYRDNEGGTGTEFDGFTTPLRAIAVVEPGVSHHIRIAIADTSDSILDSAVFIAQGGISGTQIAPILAPTTEAIEGRYGAEGNTVPVRLYYAFESNPPQLSAYGVPGATVTFSPMYTDADGRKFTNVNVVLGPDTPPGEHILTIRSAVGDAESFATMFVVVDCKPPSILGTGQPLSGEVDRGQRATLTTTLEGSNPRTYQWYQGFRGMTGNPVTGGNGPTLQTAPVNEMTPYWVRVSNPCGSVDSNTAFVMPR
ncbi:MAG TPA: choice-of-anchor L domain-containing protein [Thermoanaerobaculia bacterium]|nr:choice-of-anchor L domain-containing protein [Thermoanaerobaculia bacterium]